MKTIEVYTLEELQEKNPEAYARVLSKWEKSCDEDSFCPWQDECMASLRAIVKACHGKLVDWRLRPYSPGFIKVELADEERDRDLGEAADSVWFLRHVLEPHGYKMDAAGKVEFPGLCPFTGYCLDDDLLESVWKYLQTVFPVRPSGDSLKEALENLEGVIREHFEDSCEQQRGEDSMMANWGDCHFTLAGTRVEIDKGDSE